MANWVHREGDLTMGHDCWPPTIPADYSPDVFANDHKIVRKTDPIVPHTCLEIPETHGGVYIEERSVLANDLPMQVIGSPVSCGDRAGLGSPDVWIGD